MVDKITVWSRQHETVLDNLLKTGRHTALKQYVAIGMEDHAEIMLEAYDWLAKKSPMSKNRPADADYPVWVSFSRQAVMLPSPGTVILQLELEWQSITPINIAKWGAILNYSYIPLNQGDAKAHRAKLAQMGLSDAKAFMSRFYPQIRNEIIESWQRLFDDSIQLGSPEKYGLIWEIRKEWLVKVEQ